MKLISRVLLIVAMACCFTLTGAGCTEKKCCVKECASDCKKECKEGCTAPCCKDKK
ncbi:MAG: hypothetical protein KF841_14955 [Phycisphaerae bacterium]|nr:hypothetical protein [Phycisphaerae bacterium]